MDRKLTTDVLLQMLEQNDEKHTEKHGRLREEIQRIHAQLDVFERSQVAIIERFTKLETTPVDVEKIRFTPRVVVGIVSACLAIVVGMYASTYGLRSDVRDILTTMANQKQIDDANQRLAEERSSNLRESIEAMKRRQELQQYEIQGMKEVLLKGGK